MLRTGVHEAVTTEEFENTTHPIFWLVSRAGVVCVGAIHPHPGPVQGEHVIAITQVALGRARF